MLTEILSVASKALDLVLRLVPKSAPTAKPEDIAVDVAGGEAARREGHLVSPAGWRLWLDDERPAPQGWYHAKTSTQALGMIALFGLPGRMSLDHDLGGGDTGRDFLRALEASYPAGPVPAWTVHSQNPVGKKNMESFLTQWEREVAK